MASTGPIPIYNGSTPPDVQVTILAIGSIPSCLTISSDITRTKAAPSDICDELPAVTIPPSLNAGLNFDNASIVVSLLTPSSISTVWDLETFLPSLTNTSSTVTGTISSLKYPLSIALAALVCDSHENLSEASLVILYFSATASAV